MQLYTRAEGTFNIIIKILNPIDYKQLSFYLGRITRFERKQLLKNGIPHDSKNSRNSCQITEVRENVDTF